MNYASMHLNSTSASRTTLTPSPSGGSLRGGAAMQPSNSAGALSGLGQSISVSSLITTGSDGGGIASRAPPRSAHVLGSGEAFHQFNPGNICARPQIDQPAAWSQAVASQHSRGASPVAPSPQFGLGGYVNHMPNQIPRSPPAPTWVIE